MEPDNNSQETPLHKLMRTPAHLFSDLKEEYDSEIGQPAPQSWGDLARRSFPKVAWRIYELVSMQGIVILAAVAGEGKTWLAMYISKCISEGALFLEKFITHKGRVLYINAEMSESEMQRRGKLLGISVENTNLFFLSRDDFNLHSPPDDEEGTKDYRWLLKHIDSNKIDLVVLDTFRSIAGGLKEEKAEEVRSLFKRLHILKNSGVCVLVLDHYRKPSNFEGKTPQKHHLFGSIDKVASADVLLMLKNEGNGEIHLYQRKNRLGKEIEPFSVKMEDYTDENGDPRIRFVYGGELESKETKKEEAKELILNILSEEGRTRREVVKILQDQKIGEKNTSDALRELESNKVIDSLKRGKEKFYFLPQEESSPIPSEASLVSNELDKFFDTS